jgi:hypothetical protein
MIDIVFRTFHRRTGMRTSEPARSSSSTPTGVAETEADHFGNCPICGALLDMRDLTQVLAHVHDAEIEIGEGPEPPARDGPLL